MNEWRDCQAIFKVDRKELKTKTKQAVKNKRRKIKKSMNEGKSGTSTKKFFSVISKNKIMTFARKWIQGKSLC